MWQPAENTCTYHEMQSFLASVILAFTRNGKMIWKKYYTNLFLTVYLLDECLVANGLMTHITFSIASVKIKMSFSLFIFTLTKGDSISLLTMVPIKNENKRFWRKKNYQTLLWQLKLKEWKSTRTWSFSYENHIISILTFCSLKTFLQCFFKPKYAHFISKNEEESM